MKLKDRILIWPRSALMYFGIAKSLKEKFDCDVFYVADDNHVSKTFFEKQKIVDFKKVWSYNDYIFRNKKNVDLAYLTKFENRYKINLWNITFKDRNLYHFNKYYKFKEEEILSILEYECKFFEKIIEESNPDYLFILPTAFHQDQLLLELCQAKGIKILTLSGTRIGSRLVISEECDKIKYKSKSGSNLTSNNLNFENLQDLLKPYTQQIKYQQKKLRKASFLEMFSATIRFLLSYQEYKKYYPNYGRTPIRFLFKEATILLKKRIRKNFLNKHALQNIPTSQPFIYFPLHLEPERILLMPAPFYMNQLEIVTQIAKSLPVDHMLYVKEHPIMGNLGWRSTSFYKNIMELPNVKLIHPFAENKILLKNCRLVITIAGTAGMEAAFYGKPSIVFVETSYSNQLPSVYNLKNLEELPIAIEKSLQRIVNVSDVYKYVKLIENNSFEGDYVALDQKTHEYFYRGGFTVGRDISVSTMRKYLNDNKEIFNLLADEHIKKIHEYKNENASR